MWPFPPKVNYGFKPDSFDPRDVWRDEVYAGEKPALPKSFRVENISYKNQYQNPFCGAMAVTSLSQQKYKELDGQEHEFSQPHLFYNAGGSIWGSSVRPLLEVATNSGLIPYNVLPISNDTMVFFKDRYDVEKKAALNIPFKDAKKINGYAKVICTEEKLKEAIMQDNGVVVPVAAYGAYFAPGANKRVVGEDNHLVYLKGWDEGKWLIHDSLAWQTQGDRWLDGSYQFASAYSILDLPENWKELRDIARANIAPSALEHYGQPRSLEREISVANELLVQLKAFNNQSVLEAAGRFWGLYTNAICYGGYSYRDCINSCYNWRRTGEQLFDFNHETRQQWYNRVKGIIN